MRGSLVIGMLGCGVLMLMAGGALRKAMLLGMACGSDGSLGTGVYTSSWIAPKSDVHSQQRFFYMGQVRVYVGRCLWW